MGKISIFTETQAHRILRSQVETIVVRFDLLSRRYDPFNVSSLLISYPAIGNFIPRTADTVDSTFVLEIKEDTARQLIQLMKAQPGLMSIAADGVTVLGKSKTLFTVSIGSVSMFMKWIDLGSDVHVTTAEIKSGFQVCVEAMRMFDRGISCIPCDNAATKVSNGIVELLTERGHHAFTVRDPSHCIDLLMKDFLKLLHIDVVIEFARRLNNLVMRNRVENIRLELIEGKLLRIYSSNKLTINLAKRVLACPRNPNKLISCLDKIALSNSGITVFSYP